LYQNLSVVNDADLKGFIELSSVKYGEYLYPISKNGFSFVMM